MRRPSHHLHKFRQLRLPLSPQQNRHLQNRKPASHADYLIMRLRRSPPIVAIVGAGRVGSTMGRLLHQKGWRIGPVITRHTQSAHAARRRIGSGQPQVGLSQAVLAADLILIATPDRAIAETAEALARIANGKAWRGKIVLHTSGALGSDVLRPLALRGAEIGSLHPLQTFSGRIVPSLAGCTCAIEGTPVALRMARRISRELGGVPVVLPSRRKAAYHVAAALAAGHVLSVMEAAVRILRKVGFSRQRAVRSLLPLTRQTLANYERVGPRVAWTGPLSRRDFGVIKRHLEALRAFPREYRQAYDALSRLGLNVLANGGDSKKRLLKRTLARIK
jgi:predicted short-subunit dehydrogenase-like oxidoreductase (DUF2520 family)